jgi:multidrug efflux pump subunit AcrA (membrane-fusion protein)
MKVFMTLGLVGILTAAVVLIPKSSISQSPPSTVFPSPTVTPDPAAPSLTNSPKRLTINVSVAQPDDLKVKEGQSVKVGDLIADRGRERTRLEAQQSQLALSLTRLKTATITAPLPPAPIPAIAALPPQSHLEQEATIEQAQSAVEQAEAEMELKQQEIAYLAQLENLDPLVMEHEQARLAQLSRTHTTAVRAYQVAMGKLNTAHADQQYQQYRHGIDKAQRIESQNQVALDYQQQLASYEQRLREREYQVSQVQLKLDEVNNAIATLAVIRAPYDGKIRRVRWLGQGTDGSLTAEVTLILSSAGDPSTLPDQQPGLPESTERSGGRPER